MTGSSLPSVSTSDNGKVLTVVNGSWAAFNNGKTFSKSMSYSFSTDYWNYRKSGKTVTVGTITLDSASYSYIEIISNSTDFYIESYWPGSEDSTRQEIRFPDKNIIINNGDAEYKVTGSLYRVYGGFISVTYSGATVTIKSGFSGADQADVSGQCYCLLAFKAYI